MSRRPSLAELLLLFGGLALLAWVELRPGGAPDGWDPIANAADRLRVVTWNVGGSIEAGAPALDDDSLEDVAQLLTSIEADVVFVQELADDRQRRELGRALGSEWQSVAGRGPGRRPAILVRGGSLTRRRPTAELADRVVAATWDGPRGRLELVTLHASATSSVERHAAVVAALDLIPTDREHPAIVGGDLNLDVTLDGRADLFTDDARRDVDAYARLTSGLDDLGLGAGPTAEPDRRLDYLFATRDLEPLWAGPVRGLRRPAMDHDPVVADLRW